MRSKTNAQSEVGAYATDGTVESVFADLKGAELERLAAAVLVEYQAELERAEALFAAMQEPDAVMLEVASDHRRHEYHMSMLNVHARHQLVSLLVGRLGRVPDLHGSSRVMH